MFARLLLVVALLIASHGDQASSTKKVLFIGNSLTQANGLPSMVEALARLAGDPPIETTTIAVGGYSLEDHWNDGAARRALATRGWAMVVLQQGPSSQPDSRVLLREDVARFDREARTSGARLAIYMVWPPRSGPGTFEQVSTSYLLAARDVSGLLLPVGEAFRAALKIDPAIALFGPDGFHPTPLGTFLAAVVMHQKLTRRPEPFVPTGLQSPTGAFPTIAITAETADRIRAAAK